MARAVKLVNDVILPTGGCLFNLENRAAQVGTTVSYALRSGGSVEASIGANDQPRIRISRRLVIDPAVP
jgi:hypothetical protein